LSAAQPLSREGLRACSLKFSCPDIVNESGAALKIIQGGAMSLFNKATAVGTANAAGGDAHQQSPENALVSLLLTNFLKDQTYRSGGEALTALKELVAKNDPKFAAKAGLVARNAFGMRSVSHVLAGEIAHNVKGEVWSKSFYDNVVHRPDDITEIVAYYMQEYGKPLPNSLKQGLAKSFDKFDAYQLAKYRAKTNKISLVDVVNLVHPRPGERNGDALKALIADELRSENTWETRISAAGQDTAARRLVWKDLLETNKLGYFALLRNLRNIMIDAPDMVSLACQQLVDENRIKKSLVLPFRFTTALKEIRLIPESREVILALSKAVDIAAKNCPELDGSTLIAVDTSGSMSGRPSEIATLFAAMLYKKNNRADLLLFDTQAHPITPNPDDSVMSIAQSMPFHGGGTDFNIIFDYAQKAYDRIIILSDMQAWSNQGLYGWGQGNGLPKAAFDAYRERAGANPKIYSFDLQGYGTVEFPEKNVYCLAGFSDKIFDLIKIFESGKSMVDVINQVEL
jgi:60 kDa SS-A/Ro ribonucleoprotein